MASQEDPEISTVSEQQQVVIDLWTEFCNASDIVDNDIRKSTLKSNVSAGTRARQALRKLKNLASSIIKASKFADAAVRASRKQGK